LLQPSADKKDQSKAEFQDDSERPAPATHGRNPQKGHFRPGSQALDKLHLILRATQDLSPPKRSQVFAHSSIEQPAAQKTSLTRFKACNVQAASNFSRREENGRAPVSIKL